MNHCEKKTIITTYIESELRSSTRKKFTVWNIQEKIQIDRSVKRSQLSIWFYLKAMKKKQEKKRPLDLKLIMNETYIGLWLILTFMCEFWYLKIQRKKKAKNPVAIRMTFICKVTPSLKIALFKPIFSTHFFKKNTKADRFTLERASKWDITRLITIIVYDAVLRKQ